MNPIIATMIKNSGHSWWEARYSDGKVVAEWDTLTHPLKYIINGSSSRWEEVDKKGMVGLRLHCPNGMTGDLESPEGFKFFQFKHGKIDVIAGPGGPASADIGNLKKTVEAHIIGVVENEEGNCLCGAWEYPVVETVTWRRCWRCHDLVKTEFCHCGQDLRGIADVDRARAVESKSRVITRAGRLIQFKDNIFDMKYRHLGRLNLDVQQLKV